MAQGKISKSFDFMSEGTDGKLPVSNHVTINHYHNNMPSSFNTGFNMMAQLALMSSFMNKDNNQIEDKKLREILEKLYTIEGLIDEQNKTLNEHFKIDTAETKEDKQKEKQIPEEEMFKNINPALLLFMKKNNMSADEIEKIIMMQAMMGSTKNDHIDPMLLMMMSRNDNNPIEKIKSDPKKYATALAKLCLTNEDIKSEIIIENTRQMMLTELEEQRIEGNITDKEKELAIENMNVNDFINEFVKLDKKYYDQFEIKRIRSKISEFITKIRKQNNTEETTKAEKESTQYTTTPNRRKRKQQ